MRGVVFREGDAEIHDSSMGWSDQFAAGSADPRRGVIQTREGLEPAGKKGCVVVAEDNVPSTRLLNARVDGTAIAEVLVDAYGAKARLIERDLDFIAIRIVQNDDDLDVIGYAGPQRRQAVVQYFGAVVMRHHDRVGH
jgi:hypothetical protein